MRNTSGRGPLTLVLAVALLAAPQLLTPRADDAPPAGSRTIVVSDWAPPTSASADPVSDGDGWAVSAPVPAGDAVLVGAEWPPDARVRVQLRAATDGSWDEWHELVMSAGQGPDPESAEAAAANWAASEPVWVGRVSHLQLRVSGAGAEPEVTIHAVDVAGDDDLSFEPAEMKPDRGGTASAATLRPTIIPRSSWDPNNDCPPRSGPSYASEAKYAVVHHTAGSNSYTSSQSANIVRSICLYHRNTLGWKHIGYNLVVDKYGYIFEGRDGGVDKPVIGAHAAGFNTGSIGVSALGCFDTSCSGDTTVYRSMLDAVDAVLAWKFHIHGIDPHGTTTVTSGGSSKYPSGTQVTLDNIIGHRDVGHTACPGDRYYNYVAGGIESMADRVAERMPDDVLLPRLAGGDRITTAVELSKWSHAASDRVVIASAESFPDGLSAGPFAGSLESPVLLVPPEGVPASVADEVRRLGASWAWLIGGKSRLPANIVDDLEALGIPRDQIRRLGGTDRFETSANVAERVIRREGAEAAILALGDDFPDALSASALGAANGHAVLLVRTHELPDPTRRVLSAHTWPGGLYVVGGPNAISDEVVLEAAVAANGATVERLAGDDRYATSVAVADAWLRLSGRDPTVTLFATGLNWPDALSAGAATTGRDAAFLLVHGEDLDRSDASRDWVERHASAIQEGWISGGASAVSDDVSRALAHITE